MNCKSCGRENAENAVFCKYCGKRMDGMKLCPNCKNQIDEDSDFCIHCGAKADGSYTPQPSPAEPVVQETVVTTTVQYSKINYSKLASTVAAVAVAALALFALIFVFFTGVQASVSVSGSSAKDSLDIFYYFDKGYKHYEAIIKSAESTTMNPLTDYFKASMLLPLVFGTIISSVTLLLVFVLSVTAIVRTVKTLMGRETKSGEGFALGAFGAYIFCIIAIMVLNSANSNSLGFGVELGLNSATVAGVVLCSVAAFIWLAAKLFNNCSRLLSGNTASKCALCVGGLVLAVIIAGLVSAPAITISGEGEAKAGVLSLFSTIGFMCMDKGGSGIKTILNAPVVAALSTFAFVFLILTVIFLLFAIIKSARKLAEGDVENPPVKEFIWAFVCALASMIFHIVAGNQFLEAMGYFNSSTADKMELGYGIPIAAFVLSFVAATLSIAQRVIANKTAVAEAPAVQTVEENEVTGTEE